MVKLFEQIKEGVKFAEFANTPIPGGKIFNIAYLLILRTGEMEKSSKQWEVIQVDLKTWQDFKETFSQAYRRYQIRKKATSAAHGYGATENHTHKTEAQLNTTYALHALVCRSTEDKK